MSDASAPSLIWKGSTSDLFNNWSSSTITSNVPVESSLLIMPSGRKLTLPFTAITNSWRSCSPRLSKSLLWAGSKTTCVSPKRSRKSINMTCPWSRRLWTQPIKVTVVFACEAFSSPQLWVLCHSNSPNWFISEPRVKNWKFLIGHGKRTTHKNYPSLREKTIHCLLNLYYKSGTMLYNNVACKANLYNLRQKRIYLNQGGN